MFLLEVNTDSNLATDFQHFTSVKTPVEGQRLSTQKVCKICGQCGKACRISGECCEVA